MVRGVGIGPVELLRCGLLPMTTVAQHEPQNEGELIGRFIQGDPLLGLWCFGHIPSVRRRPPTSKKGGHAGDGT